MTTFQNLQIKLAGNRLGRIALHLLCACQDRKVRWHTRGIAREVRETVEPLKRTIKSMHHGVHRATDLCAATRAVEAIHGTVLLKKSLSRVA